MEPELFHSSEILCRGENKLANNVYYERLDQKGIDLAGWDRRRDGSCEFTLAERGEVERVKSRTPFSYLFFFLKKKKKKKGNVSVKTRIEEGGTDFEPVLTRSVPVRGGSRCFAKIHRCWSFMVYCSC